MTSQADAVKAARIYRETQPAIDELKDTTKANDAAKRILGPFMEEKGLLVFRGVTLKCVTIEVLDGDKLSVYFGDKLSEYRKKVIRKYFGLATRAKPAARRAIR